MDCKGNLGLENDRVQEKKQRSRNQNGKHGAEFTEMGRREASGDAVISDMPHFWDGNRYF